MTILEVLKSATGYLAQSAVPEARLNAEHLLAHTLGKKRLDLYLEFDRPLSDAERAPLRELVRRRAQGVPLQHLLGTVEFLGRSFLCDGRALVPRPETERLVELALGGAAGARAALDIGTGSGVIAVSLALGLDGASVVATDVSPDALALAAENAGRLGAGGRVTFVEADLVPPGNGRFDLIVANLPYIPSGEIEGLAREVKHDPATALDGGEDGLGAIRRAVAATSARLEPGGTIWLEVGHDQAGRTGALMDAAGLVDVRYFDDYAGIARFVTARAPVSDRHRGIGAPGGAE